MGRGASCQFRLKLSHPCRAEIEAKMVQDGNYCSTLVAGFRQCKQSVVASVEDFFVPKMHGHVWQAVVACLAMGQSTISVQAFDTDFVGANHPEATHKRVEARMHDCAIGINEGINVLTKFTLG